MQPSIPRAPWAVSVLLVLFALPPLWGQTIEALRLLDQDNALPIVGATFEYGAQLGVSDADGTLSVTYVEGQDLRLSHINYGTWVYPPAEVRDLLRRGVAYRKSAAVGLYPVTVLAMRPRPVPSDAVDLEYTHRMAHDGAAVLLHSPAFNSIRKGGQYGFDPVFRGFKYDQLNIVLDGAQGATAACPNRMDPPTSQMAPNMMDRIEVLKGPHALRFGAGFGATINFVGARPRFTPSPSVYGRLSGGYEGNGEVLRSEGQLGLSGGAYDLSLFGSWSQGNDYRAGNDSIVPADFQRGSFGGQLGLKLGQAQQLRVSGLYNRARDADFPALPMDLRDDDTYMLNARHDIRWEEGSLRSWNTTVFASFVDHRMDNRLKPLDPRRVNAETQATTQNYGGRTEGEWVFARGRLFAGADVRVEGAEGTRVREFLMGPNAGRTFFDNAWQAGRIAKGSAFAEAHLRREHYQFVFSARLELNRANINDPSDDFTQVYPETAVTQLNPSFSLGATRAWVNGLKVGLWLGRAQRSGGLTERFINYFPVGQDPYEMLGNPQLRPEVNNQIDLTLSWTTQRTALGLDLFAGYLQDFISSTIDPDLDPQLPMSPGVRRFVNIEGAFKTGFELNWTQELFAGLAHQLGVAYTYGQDLERDEALPEIAPLDFRYTLQGRYLNGKLLPEAAFRHVLRQGRVSSAFGETATPAFTLLDLKVAYRLSNALRFQAGVNNLLDRAYYEHLNRSVRGTNLPIFAPGRNVFGSFSLRF